MDFVWVVLGIAAVAGGLYFAATLLFGPGEPPQPAGQDLASPLPNDRELRADDLRAAVLPVSARGYRMSDVDALIERMAQQLERADRAVAYSPARDQIDDVELTHGPPADDVRDDEPTGA